MPIPVSVVILTFNEESLLAQAIESVLWADEVLVVDSYSTDATVALANSYKVRVVQHKFENYSKQRNWAIQQARHDWIFMLDADERISQPLKEEILALFQTDPPHPAYRVKRQNYFMGKMIRYSGWQNDWITRLFNRTRARYGTQAVHESLVVEGEVGRLKHSMAHYTYKDLQSYLLKHDQYSTASARDIAARGKKVTYFHLMVKPAFRFFRSYILKLGILDGKQGVVVAWLSCYSVFMRHLKVWRIQEDERQHKP